MKTVYLVRHAKSSWENMHLGDRDRPLNGRGMRDAHAMSQWLMEQRSSCPNLYSSPAVRAAHTALIFSQNFGFPLEAVTSVESLYHASPKDVLEFLKALPEEEAEVMLFSHNPTLELFLNRCVLGGVAQVPTTGVACLRFLMRRWSDLDFEAELLFFEFPKNLRES